MKNINKLFILLFLSLFVSCSNINLLEKADEEFFPQQVEAIETDETISDLEFNIQSNYDNYYSKNIHFKWRESTELNKNIVLEIGIKSKERSYFSNYIIDDEFIYSIDNKLNFTIYNLSDGGINYKIKLDKIIDPNLVMPISISKIDNYFFAGFGNGSVIKFDKKGKIYWVLDFNDLLKTPIKIHNNNIIVLFNSNKILSIDPNDASILWEYLYDLDKSSSSIGGAILSKNNILYFICPNGRLGSIDTVIGEKIEFSFLNEIKQHNVMHNNYIAEIHINDNNFVILENKKTIHTFNYENNQFSILDEKILSIDSYNFINNALLVLNNNKILKAYNFNNKKMFWQVDLTKILSNENLIINSFIDNNNIIIFFSKGMILQLNKNNGKILFKQNLKIKDIIFINTHNDYLAMNLKNGKTLFYKQ